MSENPILRIGIFGGLGRMGTALRECAPGCRFEVAEVIDHAPHGHDDPVAALVSRCPRWAGDVYLDFTHSGAVAENAQLCAAAGKPLVCGTTGLTQEDEDALERAAADIAVLVDTNMSLGVSVMRELVRLAVPLRAEGFDVELIERHHRGKADSPSGTALSLLNLLGEGGLVHGRHGMAKRTADEIGVHAVRAGGIAGEHTVLFASDVETLEIKHSLLSRTALARGALSAARFVATAPAGRYCMRDIWAKLP
jgi:4-hydroxy-tetrahydrodipicolinate reductase